MTTTAKLPFQHTIIGMLTTASGRTFIAWERQNAAHNFGTHEIFASGFCEHGHYCRDLAEALQDLAERAGVKAPAAPAKPRRRRGRRDWSHIDPSDIDPDTNEPYPDYSSPSIEPHPFGGGISAKDY